MRKEIIHELADYVTVHVKYRESVEINALKKLTRVYNELLNIAEKNADDYDRFRNVCLKKDIFLKFEKALINCRNEFEKHIK